jgi:hypothetical protein
MKKVILIAALTLMGLPSCRDYITPDCERNRTFQLEVTNGSNDTYAIYANNKFQTNIAGKKKVLLTLPAGFIKINAVQVNGYVLYPTEKYWEATVTECDNLYLVVP